MYDPELKYICISYRWGELNEQLLKTPDYTAHITSFNLDDLEVLCLYIKDEPDLKEIPYLWIDAISVDQQNHSRKNDTILKMKQIYQHASYILAVPDLHKEYLRKNTANKEIIGLIKDRYDTTVYNEIFNNEQLYINDDEISIYTYPTSQSDSTSEQLINNDDQYSFIQKSINKKLLNKMKEIEMENKKLKMEIKELKIEMKKNEKENEFKKENKELKTEIKVLKIKNINEKIKEEKTRIYQFLAYLIEDWSNRAWVISEYQVAKDKYMKHGTPLKYIFYFLLNYKLKKQPFFSYHFNDDDDQQSTINNNKLTSEKVNDPILFNQFVKSRFMQRSHLDMMLNSNATRNEDRFNVILPSWNKYNNIIANKNTISDWNITDMTSVRLKLYEIMDLWDKATLLNACTIGTVLPTFASNFGGDFQKIKEKVDYNNDKYKQSEDSLLIYISLVACREEVIKIKQFMDEYKMNFKSIWNKNLISIQFDKHHCYLSVKSKKYFIKNANQGYKYKYQNILSLDDDDELHKVFIPFSTSNLPGYIDNIDIYTTSSHINLIGNKKKNKWVLNYYDLYDYKSEHFCTDGYTFNIY